MTTDGFEQRNEYKGSPPRSVVHVGLMMRDGSIVEVELLADTGNPCAVVISKAAMERLTRRSAPDMNSNFGLLEGGWLRVFMSDLGLDCDLIGYACDAVANAARKSEPSFEGLAGLPFLRLVEYGGDAGSFWLRPSPAGP